jgi:tetratricopeptide (TPR) repeat protein
MFQEVKLAIDNENYDQAKEILSKLAMEDQNNLWIKYYQSLILEKEGNLKEAETNYRQIIKDSIYPDLHLLSQNLILRFSNNFYKFDQGLHLTKQEKTSKEKWQILVDFFAHKMPNKPLWSDFTLFGEGVI